MHALAALAAHAEAPFTLAELFRTERESHESCEAAANKARCKVRGAGLAADAPEEGGDGWLARETGYVNCSIACTRAQG